MHHYHKKQNTHLSLMGVGAEVTRTVNALSLVGVLNRVEQSPQQKKFLFYFSIMSI